MAAQPTDHKPRRQLQSRENFSAPQLTLCFPAMLKPGRAETESVGLGHGGGGAGGGGGGGRQEACEEIRCDFTQAWRVVIL